MTLATRPFGNLFSYSRNSTKWEMGPDKKFIEFPVGIPAYRYDYESGKKIGLSHHQEVTTLNTHSVYSGPISGMEISNAVSIFEGKTAKRMKNVHPSSSSIGASSVQFYLSDSGITSDVFFEAESDARVAFGLWDAETNGWDALYSYRPGEEGPVFVSGEPAPTADVRVLPYPGRGPNGGALYRVCLSRTGQKAPGNRLIFYWYPAFETPDFQGERSSILHYIGVYDVPFLTSPIWTDGNAQTRARDVLWVGMPPSATESPRSAYVEMIAESENTTSADDIYGGVGFVRDDGGITDRAWAGYRYPGAVTLAAHIAAGSDISSTILGGTIENGSSARIALSWRDDEYGFSVNGSDNGGVATSAGNPVLNRRRFQIGHLLSSSRCLNGLIIKARVSNQFWDEQRREQETAA